MRPLLRRLGCASASISGGEGFRRLRARPFSAAFTLKVSTAPRISPISSLRPRPGSTTSKLRPARRRISAVSARTGRAIEKNEIGEIAGAVETSR